MSALRQLDADLQRLYLALFPAEVRAGLCEEGEKLVILPDSLLEYVPFCALRMKDGRYLVERHELTYWPSVTAWLLTETTKDMRKSIPEALRSITRKHDSGSIEDTQLVPPPDIPVALVIGDVDFAGSYIVQGENASREIMLDPLPGTAREARAVGELLRVTPLLGTEATLDAVLDETNVIPIVHLATHGFLNTEIPEESFVALSEGKVTAYFLYETDRPFAAEMVVMSACQTGLGGEHPDSLIGLTNAFLIAGANTVVSTLWQIDDDRTVRLMTHFYEELLQGQNAAAALRTAQLHILREPELQNPYYWGAFKMTGNSANPLELAQTIH